jgi:hypothetical protein
MPEGKVWLDRAALYTALAGQFGPGPARDAWLKLAADCTRTAKDLEHRSACIVGAKTDLPPTSS